MAASAFLCATVQDLLPKLASPDLIHYVKYSKLNLLKLTLFQTSLLTLHTVLQHADHTYFFNPKIKLWMDELYDAVSLADNLIDEIAYYSLKCKVEFTQPQPQYDFQFNYKLNLICPRLQHFVQQIDILALQPVSTTRVSSTMHSKSNSVVDETVIVGRKHDKEKLMNMLMLDNATGCTTNNNNIGVVAVLGVGGVGKSTLAQLVYDDKHVNEHFDLKTWVRVSEDFNIVRVIKVLLASVDPLTYLDNENLDSLRLRLKEKLIFTRFLFVLDDFWNIAYDEWHELTSILFNGKSGSRVIITTRQERVAEVVHTFPIHSLEPLSHEECWTLLSKHAFGSENYGCHKYSDLEAIGRKIARKSQGLPLAAKTLGGLLSSKVDSKEWVAIMTSNIWITPNQNILPSLLLSYQYLPSHLKRCFAYCSIFPKGYLFDRKQLILLWMADGFLELSSGEKALEEVGDEFLSRSFIQQLNDDNKRKKFVMHDLLYDLAIVVSGKVCCCLEYGASISKNVRHFSYIQETHDTYKKFEISYDFECLRSFLPIRVHRGWNYLARKVVDELLPTFTSLRVLSLSHYDNLTVLPDSISFLLHLRYIDLSDTQIERLPNSTCELYYLQTLNLSSCPRLTELPVDIGKLVNLRHLNISGTNITKMPMQIVELPNLQTLTVDFVVGQQGDGLSLRELGKFPNLRGKLCIRNLHNAVGVGEACDANLKKKELIEELELYWGDDTNDSQTENVVLDVLLPSLSLKKLSINSYGGTRFPSWMGDSLFSNMVYLCLSYCEYCVTLPPLGQLPSLKDLSIESMSKLETIGPEFYGMSGGDSNSPFQPFPSLEYLNLSSMSNWKEWLPFGGSNFPFPRLKTLKLDKCFELIGHLPCHLSSIEEITIIS